MQKFGRLTGDIAGRDDAVADGTLGVLIEGPPLRAIATLER